MDSLTTTGRIEDAALLRGQGRFSDDLRLPGQAAAVFVRSPHAAARIVSVEAGAALAQPGVIAVLTADDLAAEGLGNICRIRPLPGTDEGDLKVPHRPALAGDRVQHVGQPVALVVAETEARARDAADLVAVEYQALPAVVDLAEASAPDAPRLWPEAPGNLALDWPGPVPGDGSEVDALFKQAAHVARVELVNQRLAVASLETRGATADCDGETGRLTFYCGSQGVSVMRDQLAAILDIPPEELRVVSHDVGGAFGMKSPAYPEYAALLVAARRLKRPVHWASTRSEAFVSDNQARDTLTRAELAMAGDGRFLALRVRAEVNVGAYLSTNTIFIATFNFARCFPTVYDIPAIDVSVACRFTNTLPTGPYRGAGRPEANYAMERLVDEAARVTGIERLALRRRNLIAPGRMPYSTAVGTVYDSGEFETILDLALGRADHAGFPGRREDSEKAGRRRGIGVSCFLEHAGGPTREPAEMNFPGDGTVRLVLGPQPGGQGHATTFSRLAARRLEIPQETVVVRQGDTDFGLAGYATVASRSAMAAGSAIVAVAERVLEKGQRAAAHLLEAAEADIEYRAGRFTVSGTDRGISLFEVAARAGDTLDTRETVDFEQSFPNGCHVAEVEIDPETGIVTLASYTSLDDCGRALEPALAEGQIQGGIAQGFGQALAEHAVYDRQSGQLVTGSFMDYALPRADQLPWLEGALHAVPCRTNPLGVKGVGEAGTTGALAALMNAINDALPGNETLDMPATPEKVWRVCRNQG